MDARRFQTMYTAYVKRKAAEELETYKMAMIGGVWSNSNWDGEEGKNPRQQFIEELEEQVNKKIGTIYGMAQEKDEFEIDQNDPFWAAMYRSLEKQHGTALPTKEEVDRAIAEMESGPGEVKMEYDQMED
jgi:hypothetical protein